MMVKRYGIGLDHFKQLPMLLILVFTGFFQSCIEPVALDLDADPELVVISNINPDNPIQVLVSKTIPLFSKDTIHLVENANVSIFEDDAFSENLLFDRNSGLYLSQNDNRPQIGKTYRLEVSAPGFDPASGEDKIPASVEFTDFKIFNLNKAVNESGMLGYTYTTSIKLNDPGDVTNYYNINFYLVTWDIIIFGMDTIIIPIPNLIPPNVLIFPSSVNENFILNPDGGLLIKDDLFDGAEKTLNFDVGFETDPDRQLWIQFFAELQSVSEDYYLYYSAIANQDPVNNSNIKVFDDPIPSYTNIKNGHGIFAGYSSFADVLVVD